MSAQRLAAAFLAGLCTMSACAVAHHRTVDAARAPFRTVPIGLCEDYPEESTPFESVRTDLALLQAAGIRDLRISIGWDSVEPSPGRYQWEFWDRFVAIADTYGIALHPYVAYTPQWNAAGATAEFWAAPPRDLAAFGAFIGALVGRYRTSIHSWEIWNEPDNPAYWTGTPAQFAALLRTGAAAVRAADPGARIVLGGIAWNVQFLEELFAEYGAAADVDVINMHSYAETWSADALETIVPYVDRVAAVALRSGGAKALWMAEMGYSSYRSGAHVSADYTARYAYEHTDAYQAVALVRMIVLALSTQRLSLVAWYELRDLPAGAEVIGDVNNRHLGVLDAQRRAKPALAALRFVHELFRSGIRSLDSRMTFEGDRGSAVVHGFERDDGAVIIAAWLPTNPADAGPDGATGAATDRRQDTVSIVLPMQLGPTATIYDGLGNERGHSTVARRGDRGARLDLRVAGGEVVVAVSFPEQGIR